MSTVDEDAPARRPRGRPRKNGVVATRPPKVEILAAAGRLFAEQGYSQTSTAEIAEAVGLTQPAIFYHFESKEELFRQLVLEALSGPLAALDALTQAQASPAAKLWRLITFHVSYDVDSPYRAGLLVDEVSRVAPKGGFEGLAEQSERYAHGIRDLIRDAMEEGQFRTVDAVVSTMAILGMCNHAIRWFRPGGRLTGLALGEQFAEFAVTALLAEPSDVAAVAAEAAGMEGLPKPI